MSIAIKPNIAAHIRNLAAQNPGLAPDALAVKGGWTRSQVLDALSRKGRNKPKSRVS